MTRKQINRLITPSFLLLAAANVTAYTPAEVKLGDSGIRMIPTIDVKQGFDDNVFATQYDEKSSGKLEIKPELVFVAERQDSKYSLNTYINSATYYSVDDADYVEWELGGEVNEVFNSRNRLDVDLSFGNYSEDKSFELQDELPDYDGLIGGMTYGFGAKTARLSFDVYADYESKDYNDANKSKTSTDAKFGGIGYVAVAPATKMLLELRRSNVAYTNDKDSDVDVDTALVGVTWEATAKTTGEVKVGQQKQTGVLGNSITDPSWEVSLTWEPQTYSSLTFGTEQSFGLETQSGDYSQYTSVNLDWKHDWTPRWNTNIGVSYKDEDILAGIDSGFAVGTKLISREEAIVGFDVTFDAARWAELTAGYEYSDRDATAEARGPLATDIYNRNLLYIAVQLSL